MVTVPFASAETTLAGTPTLQLPLASSTVVKVFVPIVTRHGATGCSTRGGTADNLRLGVFRRVDHIIACHRVDGDDRNGSIHRQVVINRGRVSGFVAHRRANSVVAGGQGAYVAGGTLTLQLPSVCTVPV